MNNKLNICICWIGIGKYNILFDNFYDSFARRFCTECNRTFIIFSDQPHITENKSNCITYNIQHACLNKEFILFRKFKYLLMAEDKYLDYDYIIYCNGNLICKHRVYINELISDKDHTAIKHFDHPLIEQNQPICKEQSLAYFNPNFSIPYVSAAFFVAKPFSFLKMANQIESWRMQDKVNGTEEYVSWHDETYYNRWCYENSININILDGKTYICPTYFNRELQICKICYTMKSKIKELDYTLPSTKDLYHLK